MMTPACRKAGRPRRDSVGERHDDLLAVALDLFIRHGYAGVTLAMVAQAAHVAVRTIYVKFGGKEQLLVALVAAVDQIHREQLAQLQDDLGALPLEGRLAALARHLLRRAGDERLRLLQAIVVAQPDLALAGAFQRAGPGRLATLLEREFAAAPPAFIDGMPPARLAEHFIACIAGARASFWSPLPDDDLASRARQGLELFLSATRRGG